MRKIFAYPLYCYFTNEYLHSKGVAWKIDCFRLCSDCQIHIEICPTARDDPGPPYEDPGFLGSEDVLDAFIEFMEDEPETTTFDAISGFVYDSQSPGLGFF
jgi:hypothetical protein